MKILSGSVCFVVGIIFCGSTLDNNGLQLMVNVIGLLILACSLLCLPTGE